MEDQDKMFMGCAIEQAQLAQKHHDMPFGAVVVRHGKIIAAAANSEHLDQDVTCHAEMKAVSQASKILGRRDLSDCTIYSSVEPCPMCAGAIFHACISRVVYAMSRDDLPHLFRSRRIRIVQMAADWHYTPEISDGVLKQKAIETFMQYKKPFRVAPTHQLSPMV